MSEKGKHEALKESEREALEGSVVVGAPDADATSHDAPQTAVDSTDAVIEAGLKGSGA
ncbi:hypothetical protein [Pengzhenrongella frigida]|uniref:hypothetical protein n=1 Tax=Pengzhenrongella frigida TaxID=1259133 RepID=UPI0013EC53BA|nr:hypothetical protein [Cellulomonas sp. HLT2-17]